MERIVLIGGRMAEDGKTTLEPCPWIVKSILDTQAVRHEGLNASSTLSLSPCKK